MNLLEKWLKPLPRAILIRGDRRSGKTTLLTHLAEKTPHGVFRSPFIRYPRFSDIWRPGGFYAGEESYFLDELAKMESSEVYSTAWNTFRRVVATCGLEDPLWYPLEKVLLLHHMGREGREGRDSLAVSRLSVQSSSYPSDIDRDRAEYPLPLPLFFHDSCVFPIFALPQPFRAEFEVLADRRMASGDPFGEWLATVLFLWDTHFDNDEFRATESRLFDRVRTPT